MEIAPHIASILSERNNRQSSALTQWAPRNADEIDVYSAYGATRGKMTAHVVQRKGWDWDVTAMSVSGPEVRELAIPQSRRALSRHSAIGYGWALALVILSTILSYLFVEKWNLLTLAPLT